MADLAAVAAERRERWRREREREAEASGAGGAGGEAEQTCAYEVGLLPMGLLFLESGFTL